ncbi:hypothetical protein SNE40_017797 [Patella caerulea]|uniref:Reverse transcriptase domain-containing protein n=1 Tax=Patella caerulea TaxID=87958 RepID=A0AAN8JB34_PATCE
MYIYICYISFSRNDSHIFSILFFILFICPIERLFYVSYVYTLFSPFYICYLKHVHFELYHVSSSLLSSVLVLLSFSSSSPSSYQLYIFLYHDSKLRLLLFKYHTVVAASLLLLLSGDIHPNPGPSKLKIIHLNIRSLQNKLDLLSTDFPDVDVITLSETWINDSIKTDILRLSNFHEPVLVNRSDGQGGGVGIYVRENLYYKRRKDLDVNGLEAAWIEIQALNKTFLVGTYYRKPSLNVGYWNELENSIAQAKDDNKPFLILGDFNCNYLSPHTRKLNDISDRFNLVQLVTEPTRITEYSSTILDLCFVNCPDFIQSCEVLEAGISDHCPIKIVVNISKPQKETFTRPIWNYNTRSLKQLDEYFGNTDWDYYLQNPIQPATIASIISGIIIDGVKAHIPSKNVTIRSHDTPWMNGYIRRLVRKRTRIHRKAKKDNTPSSWFEFRQFRNHVVSEIRKCKLEYFKKIDDKISTNKLNDRKWWNLVKSNTVKSGSTKNELHPLKIDNNIFFGNREKANALNTFFANQSQIENPLDDPPNVIPHDVFIEDPFFSIEEVSNVLLSLNINKATGPDHVNNRILKSSFKTLSKPLSILFNILFQFGTFPNIWKLANVVPVYKKGDIHDVCNYRPISLLSCLGKVFEKCLHKYLNNFLIENETISPFQSGFKQNDSTIYQLIEINDYIAKALDDGHEIKAVFCDVSRAFDRVWHKGLLNKLYAVGIRDKFLLLIENYLSNRQQVVVIKNETSKMKTVEAGVPQGSVLGPTLFLIYINDVIKNINSHVRLFADDTSLYVTIEDPVLCQTSLNDDLSKISTWSIDWKVNFNPNKTESMTFSRKKSPSSFHVNFNNTDIVDTTDHKHLGLIFNSSGQWTVHINSIIIKVGKLVDVLRSFKYKLSRKSLDTIYKSFILPIFDYADVIYDNCSKTDCEKLENIHLDALRTITGLVRGTSHKILYTESGLTSLKQRRYRHRLTIFYKLVNKLAPPNLCLLVPPKISDINPYLLRDHNSLRPVHCHTETYKSSFVPLTVRDWNDLPAYVKDSSSLKTFKQHLSKHDKQVPSYFYFGNRSVNVVHTQLRHGKSTLNYHKFLMHVSENPSCKCGYDMENTEHFFFFCPLYKEERIRTIDNLPYYFHNISAILDGNPNVNECENQACFEIVHSYISATKRFKLIKY